MAIDRYDWHYDSALEAYLERNNIMGELDKIVDELTEEQENEVCLYAADHIGLFLKWIIESEFEGVESDPKGCELVRKGEINGAQYLMKYCDGKFWDVDVSDEIRPFVEWYYESDEHLYFNDLELLPDYKFYETISGDKEFNAIKPLIDKAYTKFKSGE